MADIVRCSCKAKVALRGGVVAIAHEGGLIHRRDRCAQDLEPELVAMVRSFVEFGQAEDRYPCEGFIYGAKAGRTPPCSCTWCAALWLLVRAERGGRCVVCGCVEDRACLPDGCGWTSDAKVCCDSHDINVIVAAERLLAGEKRRARANPA